MNKPGPAILALVVLLLLAGCGGKPAPVWIAAGHNHLETFKQDFLSGRDAAIAETRFRKALEELKKGGNADLLGKAWLTRMALQVAVREEPEDRDYRRTEAVETTPVNRNYYQFLKGDLESVDVSLLPEPYRPFASALKGADGLKAFAAISAIEDPLSRLVASGLASGRRLESEALLNLAVETASEKGWKKALLVWLDRLRLLHEEAGNSLKESSIRARIELIKQPY